MTLSANQVITAWAAHHDENQGKGGIIVSVYTVLLLVVAPAAILGFYADKMCLLALPVLGLGLVRLIAERYWKAHSATAAGHRKAVIAYMLSVLTGQLIVAFMSLLTVTLSLLAVNSSGMKYVMVYAPLLVTVLIAVIFARQLIPAHHRNRMHSEKSRMAPLIELLMLLLICGVGLGILFQSESAPRAPSIFVFPMFMIGYGAIYSAALLVYQLIIVLRDRVLESRV